MFLLTYRSRILNVVISILLARKICEIMNYAIHSDSRYNFLYVAPNIERITIIQVKQKFNIFSRSCFENTVGTDQLFKHILGI